MSPVRPDPNLIVKIGSQRYVLTSEADIKLEDTSLEGIETQQPFKLSFGSLQGGCNRRFALSPDVYAYTEDGDATHPERLQRSCEVTTYDLSATYPAFADTAGHRGSFLPIMDIAWKWVGGRFYLVTPRHILLMNKGATGTASTDTDDSPVAYLEDTTKNWTVNEWAGATVSSNGYWMTVTSNTSNKLIGAGWYGKGWSGKPTVGQPYQVILPDTYDPHSVASMGTKTGTNNDGQTNGTTDLGFGAFTGSFVVGSGLISSARSHLVAFGHEADESSAAGDSTGTRDGRVGTVPVRMNWNDGTFALYTSIDRASVIWTMPGRGVWWFANHHSQSALAPQLARTNDLSDTAFATASKSATTGATYVTAADFLGRIGVILDERGVITQIVRAGKVAPISQAPITGGVDPQFAMGCCRYEGGLLTPHTLGLLFLTEGEVGRWHEVGLHTLNPGDALRQAYPLSYADPKAPYVVSGGGEIYMIYGCQLFVLNRNWMGGMRRVGILPFLRPEQGGELETAAFQGENIPRWHTICKLWADGTEYAVAAGCQVKSGGLTYLWIASSERKVYRITIRAPQGARYPTPVAATTAKFYFPRMAGPPGVADSQKVWRRIRGWFDRPHATDTLKIYMRLDGATDWTEVTATGGITADGPFSVNLPNTALGRYIEIYVLLTTGTVGTVYTYPSLILSSFEIEGYALTAQEDVVEFQLMPIRPDMRPGRESVWQTAKAENIRLEIAALRGTRTTIIFPNGNTWTVAILSAGIPPTKEAEGDTTITVRARKL